jgi:hypothetical protein
MAEVYSKSPDVVFRKIADEFILVPVRHKVADLKSVYTLNETAAFIWERIDGKNSVSQIRDAIMREFEIDPGCAEGDTKNMLSQLEALSLVSSA